MMFKSLLILCSFSLLTISSACAQTASLQSPDDFLGYSLGSRFTPHHRLVDYFKYVAGQSDKVQFLEYGHTYELRPLIAVIISSPVNMRRIEEIRQNNLRRTRMLKGDVKSESITFVHLSYSVHGNEAAGAESSMAVLYDLVKGGKPYDDWLENSIVIMDPSLNPDGYNRYSQWSNSVSTWPNNPRPVTREHDEPWPGGRSNHYYFDLNRDWAWQSQRESRDRIAFYLQWMPHVHVDIHEMNANSPYYFAPAAQPYHPYITPWQSSFQTEIGKNNAAHFDEHGWRYYTKETFDLFYPSYGDTYPGFSGAIGMTYEQGGSGFANRAVQLDNGDTLTLFDRIAHHRASSLSTIEVSSKNASRLVTAFETYYLSSIADPPGPVNSYVIKKSNHPGRIADVLTLLDRQGIIYGQIQSEKKGLKGFSYLAGGHTVFGIQNGDIIIPASQPRAVLTQVLFEPEAKLVDSLTYDITAWSVPMAYGLEAYATEEILGYVNLPEAPVSKTDATARPYAYAMQWGSVPTSAALSSLLQQGIVARYAKQAFRVGGVPHDAGTVLLMRGDNRKNLLFDDIVKEAAFASSVTLSLINTGLVDTGRDLGSDEYVQIRRPEVLTFAGKGVSSLNLGEIWHFFEEELRYPVHIVGVDRMDQVGLEAYNVIILPEGYYQLDNDMLSKLDDWVVGGGRLIALGSGIQRVAGQDGFGIELKSSGVMDSIQREEAAHHPDVYSSGERKSLSDDIPGAVFKTTMDMSHPLTFGLGQTYWTLKTNVTSYAFMTSVGNAIYLDDSSHHYGFAGYKALEKTKNTVIAAYERKGGGSAVYLVDNPLFRSFWNSGKVLFSNALFF